MAATTDSFPGEFFILGEDWSLYEEFVPRESFCENEIRARQSKRYYSADGRSIFECPVSIATRKIALTELERFFHPILRLTERVQTCEFINPPDYYCSDALALIRPNDTAKVKPGLYGKHVGGVATSLFGSGVRPLSDFAKSIVTPLARFCSSYRLILLLHSEHPLDVSDAGELLRVIG